MPILGILFIIIVIGVVMYLINTYVKMAAPYGQIFNLVVVLLVILWLAQVFGLFALGGHAHPYRYRLY